MDNIVSDHPLARAFILHWGEMGTHWGVNRSIAQIHALLYLSDRPLPAEEISDKLGLARSNVSAGLHELQAYDIVRRVHVEGDRRDHFVAETDLWEMLMRIVAERKRREIDATVEALNGLTEALRHDKTAPEHVRRRIGALHDFLAEMNGWYAEVRALPRSTLLTLMRLGGRIARFIPASRARKGAGAKP
jgi:DNA-binding transcriptional regulator GbsR (MarR family)